MLNWETLDDEKKWEDVPPPPRPPAPRRWRWWIVAAVFGGLLLLATAVYWQINQRVTAYQEALTADLAASQSVITLAAQNRDVELFRNYVSRNDYRWARGQDALIERGLLLDRTPYGLTLLPQAGQVVDVLTSPQQTRTRVTTAYGYQTAAGQTITLYQVALYEKRGTRWRLAAPEADFWGTTQQVDTGPLTIRYPARDEAILQRILPELVTAVADWCARGIPCPSGVPIAITFTAEAEAIYQAAGFEASYFAQNGVRLPTLGLFGMPSDPAAEAAVARAYANQIAISLLVQYGAYGGPRMVDQVVLERRLDELGIRPWPQPPTTYLRYFQEPFPLSELLFQTAATPRLTERELWQQYLLGDYLTYLQATGFPTAVANSRANPQRWLADEYALSPTGEGTARFLTFVAERGQLTAAPPPIPWPTQTIHASCLDATGMAQFWQQYSPAAETWATPQPVARGTALVVISPTLALLDAGGFYQSVGGDGFSLGLAPQPATRPWLAGEHSPAGDKLLARLAGTDVTRPRYAQIALDQCPAKTCALQPLAGYPVWSPSGAWHLAAEGFEPFFSLYATTATLPAPPTIHLADSAGVVQASFGTGFAPFWLGEQMMGWARPRPTAVPAVDVVQRPLVADAETAEATTVLLQWEEIVNHLPVGYEQTPFQFWQITAVPGQPHLLLLVLTTEAASGVPEIPWQGATHLLLYEWATHTWRKTISLTGKAWSLNWSPKGEQVLVQATRGYNSVLDTADWRVVDSWEHTVAPPPSASGYTWSADGQWLVGLNNGFLTLNAPAYGYQRVVLNPNLNLCQGGGINN